jgi:hypothetical protein
LEVVVEGPGLKVLAGAVGMAEGLDGRDASNDGG